MKLKFDKRYLGFGLTAFIVIMASIFTIFAFINIVKIADIIAKGISILSPILYGMVIAYLLSPSVNVFHKKIQNMLDRYSKKLKQDTKWKISRVVSIFVTMVLTLLIVSAIVGMVIPQLITSITGLVQALPQYVDNAIKNTNKILDDNPFYLKMADNLLNNFKLNLNEIYKQLETFLPSINSLITKVTSSVFTVLNVLKNILIGLIVSLYLLYSKEQFLAQFKKLIYAVIKKDFAENFFVSVKHTHKVFGGFIVGKIIDSLIIGILCFIVMLIFDWPFAVLISVIVGVTNVIPFFGPFIGAIPSAIIILLVDPMTCLYFIIFILILQQFDGNILGPKILGDSTGLSCFWVIFSILVAGGMFGFIGMVIGVPCFAVIYTFIKMLVTKSLKNKNMPIDTQSYIILNDQDVKEKKIDKKKTISK